MTADEDWQPKPVYSGLCIEGPLAGSWESHETPFFRCVEPEPLDLRVAPEGKPFDISTVTTKTHTYKHIIGFRHRVKGEWTDDVLNFWIPEGKTWTPLDCVRKMAEDYANYHDLRNS